MQAAVAMNCFSRMGMRFFALIHFWPGNAIKIRTRERLPIEQWLTLGWTYDGSSRASGMAFYLNGQPMEVEIKRDSLYRDISYGGNTPLQLAADFVEEVSRERPGQPEDLRSRAERFRNGLGNAPALGGRPVH